MKKIIAVAAAVTGYSNVALAAGGAKFVNYYEMILHKMGLNHDQILEWQPVVGGLLTLALITIMGLSFKKSVEASGDNCEPEGKFSLRTFIEMIFDFVNDLARDIIGEKSYGRFMFLLTGLFLFIFISNLSGLIPGFPPATESINTNLAMSGIVFLVYNWVGIKEHKGSYVKQFIGPLWWMAPLMVVIEVIAHIARPISLSLRLYGNIFGDHLVLSVFTGLTYVIVPAFLLFFGLLVASLQSFVFTLLSSIYISMAISHDH